MHRGAAEEKDDNESRSDGALHRRGAGAGCSQTVLLDEKIKICGLVD
jgi:hypothetical protein